MPHHSINSSGKQSKAKVARRKNERTREYQGYVYVNEDGIKKKGDFDYLIGLALEFNKIVKASHSRTGLPVGEHKFLTKPYIRHA